MAERLTVAQALEHAKKIELNLDTWERTAPGLIRELGGRDALLQFSEMTCIGPIPRLPQALWERASAEYEEHREHGSSNRGE